LRTVNLDGTELCLLDSESTDREAAYRQRTCGDSAEGSHAQGKRQNIALRNGLDWVVTLCATAISIILISWSAQPSRARRDIWHENAQAH
jgi:hypothetical protein